MVALKRSIKDVLNCLHPLVMVRKCCAFSRVPQVSLCVTSTTRFFFVCLITVAIQSWGQTANLALPGPACFFTFSRKTRRMLLGYAFHPSVQTRSARTP